MIINHKIPTASSSPKMIAGQRQESEVAFFLRRAFKDLSHIYVLHDVNVHHNDEHAQIDHLIIYPYGFILVESKSINGEVKVNQQGEWTRSYRDKWFGIPSPIKQLELQQTLLREYLFEHRAQVLTNKMLGVQQTFGGRQWDNICVISSHAIIHRDHMPSDISNQIIKTEFLVEKLQGIMKIKQGLMRKLVFDSRPAFNQDELTAITQFLVPQKKHSDLACKSCGETELIIPQYGRYGYFVTCQTCQTNTSMKIPCPQCHSKQVKVSKQKQTYSLLCNDCNAQSPIFEVNA